MTVENRRKIVKLIALAVIIGGLAVIAGWIFGIGILTSVWPAWIPMKFSTAVTFVISGISLYFIVRALEGDFDKAQVVLSITSMIIILLMGLFFFSALLKIRTGAEDLFIKEAPGNVKTVTPGRPSFPTTLNFMLIAAAGILTIWHARNLQLKLRVIGLIVASIGALAIIGYCVNVQLLYYYIEGVNSAIAFSTAALFVLLGAGLLCL